MATSYKGRVKSLQVGNKVTKDRRNGEIKPIGGNLRDLTFSTDLALNIHDLVEFVPDGKGGAKILRKLKE